MLFLLLASDQNQFQQTSGYPRNFTVTETGNAIILTGNPETVNFLANQLKDAEETEKRRRGQTEKPSYQMLKNLAKALKEETFTQELLTSYMNQGFDINFSVIYENPTLLIAAVDTGRCDYVEKILNAGADIDLFDVNKMRNPITSAINKADLNMVNKLVELGANVLMEGPISRCDEEYVKRILPVYARESIGNEGWAFSDPNYQQNRPSHEARLAQLGEIEKHIQSLHSFIFAASEGRFDAVFHQIENGFETFHVQGNGYTALEYAIKFKNQDAIERLATCPLKKTNPEKLKDRAKKDYEGKAEYDLNEIYSILEQACSIEEQAS